MPTDMNATEPAVLAITADGGEVIGENGSRIGFIIQNPSDSGFDIAIGYGGNPSAFPGSNGIIVKPGGTHSDSTGYGGPVFARGAGAVNAPYVEVGR